VFYLFTTRCSAFAGLILNLTIPVQVSVSRCHHGKILSNNNEREDQILSDSSSIIKHAPMTIIETLTKVMNANEA
jgi:hypothetical protein